MKSQHLKYAIQIIILTIFSFLILSSCSKDEEEPIVVPDPILTNNYHGSLWVQFKNTLPPWSVSTSMNVYIDKVNGEIDIDNTTLSYSGDTIILEESKIERSGQWHMNPIGLLKEVSNKKYIEIDAQIQLQNDIQHIYALDNEGNWILVNETAFNETPASDLSFDFNDASIDGGSYCYVAVSTGSIIWRLTLSPAIVP